MFNRSQPKSIDRKWKYSLATLTLQWPPIKVVLLLAIDYSNCYFTPIEHIRKFFCMIQNFVGNLKFNPQIIENCWVSLFEVSTFIADHHFRLLRDCRDHWNMTLLQLIGFAIYLIRVSIAPDSRWV